MRAILPLNLAAILATCTAAQEPSPAPRPAPTEQGDAAASRELLAQFASGGVRLDLAARTITIDAVTNHPADPIEYLLVHPRGKLHEALFVSEVKPSLLAAAFLALGCDKGTNARAKPIEPPPTEAEIEKGAPVVDILPPEGNELRISARWRGDDGKEHDLPIEALLLDMTTGKPVEQNAWIFLGGREAPLYRKEPPVFVADYEGNLVSVCYMAPENHLITMRHERGPDDENWWITEESPPPGTKVELRFQRVPPAAAQGAAKKGEAKNDGADHGETKKADDKKADDKKAEAKSAEQEKGAAKGDGKG